MRRTRQAIAMDMADAEIERRRSQWFSDGIQVSSVPWADGTRHKLLWMPPPRVAAPSP
ncbi:hypothetical protein ACFZAD_14130 [Streptomyces iakyrus]|uniref:hypothetical protein n=1 Tax=Streptomyces iakyrus TaxID=68219 RepID=UPI0036F0DF0C